MNPIKELYANLTNEELELAMEELLDSEETGVIVNDGMVREIDRRVSQLTGTLDIHSTQINVYRECAIRWVSTRTYSKFKGIRG